MNFVYKHHNGYVSRFNAYLGRYAGNAEAHYARGIIYILDRQLNKAKQSILKALVIRPEWAEALQSLAILQFEMGEVEDAYERIKYAVSLRPNSLRLVLNACQTCYHYAYYSGTIEVGEQVLQITDDPQIATTILGWIAKSYAAQGNVVVALDAAQRAVNYVPHDAWLHNNVAVFQLRLGRFSEAIKTLQGALDLNPHLEVARRNIQLAHQLGRRNAPHDPLSSKNTEASNDHSG